jgi:CTP synthase
LGDAYAPRDDEVEDPPRDGHPLFKAFVEAARAHREASVEEKV